LRLAVSRVGKDVFWSGPLAGSLSGSYSGLTFPHPACQEWARTDGRIRESKTLFFKDRLGWPLSCQFTFLF
jgi:hypothetical protein